MQFFTLVLGTLVLLIGNLSMTKPAENDIGDLAWMGGHWSGNVDGVDMEEFWLPPKGNSMLALHRDVKDGETVSFEFLRVEATADGITYWASPKGKPATPFRMSEHSEKRVVFENAEKEFPHRIIYWVDGGELHAKIEGTLGGKPAAEEWTWRKS